MQNKASIIHLHQDYLDIINERFNVVAHIKHPYYTRYGWHLLDDVLSETRKEEFGPDEIYLVEDMIETYYLPQCDYSVQMFNIIKCFIHHDISLEKVLIMTMNNKLESELDGLIPHTYGRPKIFYSSVMSSYIRGFLDNDSSCSVDDVTHHALCLMRQPRTHRHILFKKVKEHEDKILISYSGDNNVT